MALQRLREAAEKAKIELSSSNNVREPTPLHYRAEEDSLLLLVCVLLWAVKFHSCCHVTNT